MSPLDNMSWWEIGLWCSLVAIFGSFIRSFVIDNITSVSDIFKQMIMAIFVAMIICLYGNYRGIDKRIQLIFSAFAGMVGLRAIFYVTSKIGMIFGEIGKFLEGTNDIAKESEKRKTDLPHRRERRKRKAPHNAGN